MEVTVAGKVENPFFLFYCQAQEIRRISKTRPVVLNKPRRQGSARLPLPPPRSPCISYSGSASPRLRGKITPSITDLKPQPRQPPALPREPFQHPKIVLKPADCVHETLAVGRQAE